MQNDLLSTIIEHCKKNCVPVSIFDCDSEPEDGNWTGYIAEYNNQELMIEHITVNGEDDGLVWMYRNDVMEIDYGGPYEEKIKTLYQLKKQDHLKIELTEKTILLSLLQFCKDQKKMITIDTNDMSYTGMVMACDKDALTIQEVNRYGEKQSINTLFLSRVRLVQCEGKRERYRRLLLEEYRKSINKMK